jgi:uncharacterized protein (DUF885 family)
MSCRWRELAAIVCMAIGLVRAHAAEPATPAARLRALYESAWQRDLADDPLAATYYGDKRFNHRWPDIAPAARARSLAADKQVLVDLAAIPGAGLSPAEALNRDLFRRTYQTRIAAARFEPEFFAFNAHDGPQTLNEVAESMPFDGVADYETWLRRIEALPAFIDQTIVLLREAAAQKRTQPRVLVERMLPLIALQIVDDPARSPFYERFKTFPAAVPEADRIRLRERAARLIAEQVVPAYRRYDSFMRHEYLSASRDTVGLWDTPDGAAFYAERVRFHTGSTLTPDEIHALGLAEVARIHVEMQKVMDELGFKGSRQAFFDKLRTDPQFYYATPEELFRAYVFSAKMIEPELPRLFGKLYRIPFGVRAIPAAGAPNTTAAYYYPPSDDGTRAGYYYVNLYRPEMRPKYEVEVLTAHESVPGHHLQFALAHEIGELPSFRRNAAYTAFVEGWALYSERLGYELGLYKDPYSRFGQLTYDMWRALRLVIDTGLHHKRWTRQQAIDYFKDNAAKTETDIVNEIDRYIGWPGQALAYKIGQLKILELRALAERELGTRFDIRSFHDTVLGSGAVPLDVLEANVRRWVAARQGRAASRSR